MKFSFANPFICLLLLAFTAMPASAEYQKLDGIVAIVDEDVISESDVRLKIQVARENLARQQNLPRQPSEQEIRKQVIDRLILESLQLQMAERAGISVTDEQLNQAMQNIASRNGFTLAQFRDELQSQGVDYTTMREQIRKDMLIQQVQQGNLRNRIQVTDEEVDNFLASSEGQKLTGEQYHLAHILLPVAEQADKAEEQQAKAELEDIRRQLQQGQLDFASLVQGMTVNGHKLSGTDFGMQNPDQLPSLFADAAKKLAAGQISAPLRSGAGWHLLYLADKKGGNTIIHQEKARHILIQPSEVRDMEQARALADELHQRIMDGADFALLAREYSDDNGSALQGGDLGWNGKGQFVPAFEDTLAKLAVDEISEPVQTQYGWHIIQKTGEREHDATREQQRQQARQAIFQRKFADELDAWLVKIREEAFVEMK